jgi:hypothetical protein
MNGARIERLGIVRAHDYEGAIYQAMEKFKLEERQQRRLIVWREDAAPTHRDRLRRATNVERMSGTLLDLQ